MPPTVAAAAAAAAAASAGAAGGREGGGAVDGAGGPHRTASPTTLPPTGTVLAAALAGPGVGGSDEPEGLHGAAPSSVVGTADDGPLGSATDGASGPRGTVSPAAGQPGVSLSTAGVGDPGGSAEGPHGVAPSSLLSCRSAPWGGRGWHCGGQATSQRLLRVAAQPGVGTCPHTRPPPQLPRVVTRHPTSWSCYLGPGLWQ